MAAIQQLMRSALVVAGLLIAGVGIADTIAGHSKVLQYEELLRTSPAPEPPDPAALFPTASESQERHELARAKLGYYQLLLSAGRFLTVLGLALVAIGVLRLRLRAIRASPESVAPVAN
jgi:hypothetical protein